MGPDDCTRHSNDLFLFGVTHNASIRVDQPVFIGMHTSDSDHKQITLTAITWPSEYPNHSATLGLRASWTKPHYHQLVIFTLLLTNVENDDDNCIANKKCYHKDAFGQVIYKMPAISISIHRMLNQTPLNSVTKCSVYNRCFSLGPGGRERIISTNDGRYLCHHMKCLTWLIWRHNATSNWFLLPFDWSMNWGPS